MVNELNMGSTSSHKTSREGYSSGAKAAQPLPPMAVESIASGKKTPLSSGPKNDAGAVNRQGRGSEASIAEVAKTDSNQTAKAVEDLNKVAMSLQRDLNFKVDEDTGKSIITVTDSATQKVIRQIPSEEVVELAKNLQSMVQSEATAVGSLRTEPHTGSLLNITA